jgi:hypothetical protein
MATGLESAFIQKSVVPFEKLRTRSKPMALKESEPRQGLA